MNNITAAVERSESLSKFAQEYFKYLYSILNKIKPEQIEALASAFLQAREENKTIFVAGNGGSAATSTTMANDVGFDILKKSDTEKPFRLLALTDNTSVITAIANDVGYEDIFINQLKIHYRKGDSLLVISASGNSPNIIKAVEWVKTQGGKTIAFLGFDGGKLMKLCDISVHVPSEPGEYGPVEDAHLILNHILAHWFQIKLRVK